MEDNQSNSASKSKKKSKIKLKRKPKQEKNEDDRGTWSGKLDFVMSSLSFAVGMGNLWRFPYLVYLNGGGAFLIPYLIMVVFAGFPIIFMEFCFGQYGSLGVVSIWKACPLFQGIGWTMFCVSFISCIYYNMLIAYSFFYTFASFAKDVPWRGCDNYWNTPACGVQENLVEMTSCKKDNGTWFNETCHMAGTLSYSMLPNISEVVIETKRKSPTDEYFHNYMLNKSDGIDDIGEVRWPLALCLLLCWILVSVGLITGIKSLGKATYVTSLLPYVILMILFIKAVTLEGSTAGILYYLTPQWHRLASAKVWGDAAVQVFFSMSCCWGGLITLASYNKFENNCLRDSIIVAVGDCLTSIFGGVVIFAILGYMSHELGVPIDKVATQGAGLAFIVYPQAVTTLPVSPLWSVLFMLMLVNLGIGTQFTLVTTAHTTLLDVFKDTLRTGRRPTILLISLCAFCYLIGLTITTRGGIYVLQIMDTYAPSYGLLVIGLTETLVIGWVYGADRFYKDIEQMLGYKPSRFWMICWRFITPGLIIFILLFSLADFKRSTYGDYLFPLWADGIGWCIAGFEIACIPGVAIYKIVKCQAKLPLLQKIKYLTKPANDWGPAHEIERFMTGKKEETNIPLNTPTEIDENSILSGAV